MLLYQCISHQFLGNTEINECENRSQKSPLTCSAGMLLLRGDVKILCVCLFKILLPLKLSGCLFLSLMKRQLALYFSMLVYIF